MSMTETIKLYDRDAYAIEFEADVISCEPNKADDKQFDIILNQTLFFPEEGGQSPDMGCLLYTSARRWRILPPSA